MLVADEPKHKRVEGALVAFDEDVKILAPPRKRTSD
jgi:hypothetical protein